MQPARPVAAARGAQDDARHVAGARVLDEFVGNGGTAERYGLGAQLLSQPEALDASIALGLGQADQCRRLDEHHDPRRVQCGRQSFARADERVVVARGSDAHQHAFPREPRLPDRGVAPVALHRGIDTLGGLAQRQFAQCNEIALAEEACDRDTRLLRNVHLAFVQPLQQIVGR